MIDIKTIKITSNADFINEQNHITPYIQKHLEKIYTDVLKRKASVYERLQKYIQRYPKVPIFKNYLTTYYMLQNNPAKAYECNRWVLKKHPKYLFATINLGNEYIAKQEYDKVEKLFGEEFLIQNTFSDREEFHIDEIISYYIVVIKYYFEIDDPDSSELIIKMLYELDPYHHKLDVIEGIRMNYNFKKNQERYQEENKHRKSVKSLETKRTTITNPPKFVNKSFAEKLYTKNLDEYSIIISEIDKDDCITPELDLAVAIQDAINRYTYFEEAFDVGRIEENNLAFLSHAIILMREFEIPNGLDLLFNFFRQDHNFIDFWLGDMREDLFTNVLIHYGKDKLESFVSFLTEPNINTYNKAMIGTALIMTSSIHPELKEEVNMHSQNVLRFFQENFENPLIGDTDFLGLFIADLMNVKAVDLLDDIKILFDKEYVGYGICGSYEDVVTAITSEESCIFRLKDINTIQQHYEYLVDNWYKSHDFKLPIETYEADILNDNDKPVLSKKVGRNDPCPCGSGKKYKKCCL